MLILLLCRCLISSSSSDRGVSGGRMQRKSIQRQDIERTCRCTGGGGGGGGGSSIFFFLPFPFFPGVTGRPEAAGAVVGRSAPGGGGRPDDGRLDIACQASDHTPLRTPGHRRQVNAKTNDRCHSASNLIAFGVFHAGAISVVSSTSGRNQKPDSRDKPFSLQKAYS